MGKITDTVKSLIGISESDETRERKLENTQIKEYIVENFAQRFNELQPGALYTSTEKSVKEAIVGATSGLDKDYFKLLADKDVSGIKTQEKFVKEVIKELKKVPSKVEQDLIQGVEELAEELGVSQKKEDIGDKVLFNDPRIRTPAVLVKDVVTAFTKGLAVKLQKTKPFYPELPCADTPGTLAPPLPVTAPPSYVDREEERRNNAPGQFGPTI